ncbi:17688_t:CDS:1 [Acaulospora morrowiae]|uniref:17688_t:CDS:1 n=1 Tax=Acaulospora morrowiae TaxID=94023 RepID=A0A9N9I3H5_9GLOM|nr:17688_t:CDS:1 [Acaulospora morrowiae]
MLKLREDLQFIPTIRNATDSREALKAAIRAEKEAKKRKELEDHIQKLKNQVQKLTEKYNVSAVFNENESGVLDMEFEWHVRYGKEGRCDKNCLTKNDSIRKISQPIKI